MVVCRFFFFFACVCFLICVFLFCLSCVVVMCVSRNVLVFLCWLCCLFVLRCGVLYVLCFQFVLRVRCVLFFVYGMSLVVRFHVLVECLCVSLIVVCLFFLYVYFVCL